MIRRFRAAVLVLAVTCVLAPVAEANDNDDRGGGFSVRDVDGPMAFAFDGFATAVVVGRFVADGLGHLNDGVRTLVVGGTTVHQTFTLYVHETFDFVIV